MEAERLKRKKTTISKGKIKKTIKNIICRPDPTTWPLANDEEAEQIKSLLSKHSVEIPKLRKLPWNELKLISKNERPKQPTIDKVAGLLFGMSTCRSSIQSKECAAILIEAKVNPRTIVQPIIADCLLSNIPVICMQGLKYVCANSFGIPTSCLGIQSCMEDLVNTIHEISSRKHHKNSNDITEKNIDDVVIQDNNKSKIEQPNQKVTTFSYLYRTNKKFRIFVPSNQEKCKVEFAGQHFIKLTDDVNQKQPDSMKYKKMILKRMQNNPNRVKVKNK